MNKKYLLQLVFTIFITLFLTSITLFFMYVMIINMDFMIYFVNTKGYVRYYILIVFGVISYLGFKTFVLIDLYGKLKYKNYSLGKKIFKEIW